MGNRRVLVQGITTTTNNERDTAMRQYRIGQRLTYTHDGRTVEFRGYAKHDQTGAYVAPSFGHGSEMYVDIRQLQTMKGSNK